MNRELEHGQMVVQCTNGHPPREMAWAGFYALKEAGAAMTIIAFECGACFRKLYVTSDCPSPPDLEGIDSTP